MVPHSMYAPEAQCLCVVRGQLGIPDELPCSCDGILMPDKTPLPPSEAVSFKDLLSHSGPSRLLSYAGLVRSSGFKLSVLACECRFVLGLGFSPGFSFRF